MTYRGYEIVTASAYTVNGRCTYHKVMVISPRGSFAEAGNEDRAKTMIDNMVDGAQREECDGVQQRKNN